MCALLYYFGSIVLVYAANGNERERNFFDDLFHEIDTSNRTCIRFGFGRVYWTESHIICALVQAFPSFLKCHCRPPDDLVFSEYFPGQRNGEIILAQMHPVNKLFKAKKGVYLIGDALIPRRGNSAILDGYRMGMRL